jgi:uncharacterized protein YbjT (DUF2867 family)
MRHVALLGASGLVGGHLLERLDSDPSVSTIHVVTRRALPVSSPKVVQHVFDLDDLGGHPEALKVDQVFCALGTTIAKAGSQARFRIVDFDYPLAAARLARAAGARHFLLVSSLGASARSRVFYNRVKGELEQAILALDYPSVTIARPSLLLGGRNEHRRGEEFAKRFAWITPSKYKPIEADTVARAMVESAKLDAPGHHVLESREMRERWEVRTATARNGNGSNPRT